MLTFVLAVSFQTKKKNSSLIGSSIFILGSEAAPTRTLVQQRKGQKYSNNRKNMVK